MGNEIIQIAALCVQLSRGSATNGCVTRMLFCYSCGHANRIESSRTKTLKIHTHSSCKRFAHWTPSVTLYEARGDQLSDADIYMSYSTRLESTRWVLC